MEAAVQDTDAAAGLHFGLLKTEKGSRVIVQQAAIAVDDGISLFAKQPICRGDWTQQEL